VGWGFCLVHQSMLRGGSTECGVWEEMKQKCLVSIRAVPSETPASLPSMHTG